MSNHKKALLGLHDIDGLSDLYSEIFDSYGYNVDSVRSLDGVLQLLQPQGLVASASPVFYDWIIMDVNLGENNGASYEPGKRIYGLVRPYVDEGRTRFIAISGGEAAAKALNAGIPAMTKPAPELMQMIAEPILYQKFYERIRKGP